jgi:hypothetical protein
MPPVSEKQRALMHGVAKGGIPAGRGGPSKAVAKEFAAADKPGRLPKRAPKGKGKGKW